MAAVTQFRFLVPEQIELILVVVNQVTVTTSDTIVEVNITLIHFLLMIRKVAGAAEGSRFLRGKIRGISNVREFRTFDVSLGAGMAIGAHDRNGRIPIMQIVNGAAERAIVILVAGQALVGDA